MDNTSIAESRSEDHALNSVPDAERKGWVALSWTTTGLVTGLVQLFLGALITFVAGFKVALAAGILVTVVGALMGWGCGHIAYRSGLSSTVLSRKFGFGHKGSIVSSVIFAFMIIGFLAIENALLYSGFVFYFHLHDTITTRVVVYGLMTFAWVLLTAYGFNLVARVSTYTLAAFLVVLAYITYLVISGSSESLSTVASFPSQFPAAALQEMGITSEWGKFIFAVNMLIGSAGALALVDADIGRYAKRSRDIGIAALFGNVAMDIFMLSLGGIIMHAGAAQLIAYYQSNGMSLEAAQQASLAGPDSITAAFIVFSGGFGALLMVLAQSKTQVLNTYSASLSLSNLADVLSGWRPGRILFVVVANIIGLVMLYGKLLSLVNSYVTLLGVLTTAFAGVIIADYFIVRPQQRKQGTEPKTVDACNFAGVATTVIAFVLSHWVLNTIVPIEFVTTVTVCLIVYPVLRLWVLRPSLSLVGGDPRGA